MLVNNIDTSKKKNKSEFNYINLEKLVNNFELDFTFDSNWVPYGQNGFISKSYFKSPPEESGYSHPPKGPIEEFFECTFCGKSGPGFHSKNCQRPFDTSLVLSDAGAQRYPGREAGTSYLLIAKKSGQTKFVSESLKSGIFYDSVQLIYQYQDHTKATVRISRNGTINIISAKYTNQDLPAIIVEKINKAGCLTPEFKEIAPKFVFLPNISYKYQVFSQFSLYPDKKDYHIDLVGLNENLWNGVFHKKYQTKDVFMLDNVNNIYFIEDYNFNTGSTLSRTNKETPSLLKFVMKHPENVDVKIGVFIYTRGAVQMRLNNAVKGKIPDRPLQEQDLYQAYEFIKEILKRILERNEIVVKEAVSYTHLTLPTKRIV